MSNLVKVASSADANGNVTSYVYGLMSDAKLAQTREMMDVVVIESGNEKVLAQKIANMRERNGAFIDIGLVTPEYLPLIRERLRYTDAEQREREEQGLLR